MKINEEGIQYVMECGHMAVWPRSQFNRNLGEDTTCSACPRNENGWPQWKKIVSMRLVNISKTVEVKSYGE